MSKDGQIVAIKISLDQSVWVDAQRYIAVDPDRIFCIAKMMRQNLWCARVASIGVKAIISGALFPDFRSVFRRHICNELCSAGTLVIAQMIFSSCNGGQYNDV